MILSIMINATTYFRLETNHDFLFSPKCLEMVTA